MDYSPKERRLILEAPKIYYPTSFYAGLLRTLGKPTFPSFQNYDFALNKLRQSAMFQMMGIPHPRTRIFYGPRQKSRITDHFPFPFVAKKARGSARGDHVFLIKDMKDLARYLDQTRGPAYIQEYLPVDRDLRVIIIGDEIALSYWRCSQAGEFRTNISRGGRICFDPLPGKALDLALETARRCGWNDVGLDIICHEGRFYVLEANMKYGLQGFKRAGISYRQMLCSMVADGRI